MSTDDALKISECLFQNNFKNYKWSAEEDLLLKNTILYFDLTILKYISKIFQIFFRELNPKQYQKNEWKTISNLFNSRSNGIQARKPAQCKERWENMLKKNYKKLKLHNIHFSHLFFEFQEGHGQKTKTCKSSTLF